MIHGYQPYIVLSTPRSGSQHLTYLLHSHPHIKSYSEPFQPYYHFGNPDNTIFEHSWIYPLYKRYRDEFPVFLVKYLLFKKYTSQYKAVGFKIFYDQAQQSKARYVWPYLRSLTDLKIIHLKRKNMLKSLVSYEVGDQTNKFMKFDTKPSPDIQIRLTHAQCEAYFRHTLQSQEKFASYFRNHSILDVAYESLAESPKKEILKILQFLGISPMTLTSPLKKQITRPLGTIIMNYTSLKKSFAHTKWAEFFE